jgi:hypothetical protein
MGKWKKKLRKFAKKAAPIAMLALGAAALAKRRKAKALNAITAGDIVDTGPLSGKAGFEGDVPSAPAATQGLGKTDKVDIVSLEEPVSVTNKSNNTFRTRHKKTDSSGKTISRSPGQLIQDRLQETGEHYTPNLNPYIIPGKRVIKGGRFNLNRAKGGSVYKSGGRVGVGKAKRGFGRALRKK